MRNDGDMVQKMVVAAMVSVLIAVCSYIQIPGPYIPFTLQTFAVVLAWKLMGGLRGSLAVTIYLLLGIVGVPVFAGFSSGIGVLIGPTGGYLLGFIPGGIVYAIYQRTIWPKVKHRMVGDLIMFSIGILLCYAMGFIWFATIYAGETELSLLEAFLYTVVPYILPDAVKIFLGWKVGAILEKALSLNRKVEDHGTK